MTALIIIASILAWLAGAYLTSRQYALNELEGQAQFHASLTGLYKPGTPLIDDDDRTSAWGEALAVCAFGWPIVLAWYGVRRVVSVKPLVPPTERARLERRELEELRRKVREYGIEGGESL